VSIALARLTGEHLKAALPELARLRIAVFRDWPYLYDGTLDYEEVYLAKLAAGKGALVVAAYDDRRMIGAATGAPLAGQAEEFAAPFQARGFDIGRIYYFGESVLLKPYRGRGLGHAFFDEREAHALGAGAFTHTAFCGVVRSNDHPMRPPDYVPLDGFWRKRGYARMDGMVASFAWKDIGETAETAKLMQFWMRAIDP
jgi:GNAT superfamily N-acetyltransferase